MAEDDERLQLDKIQLPPGFSIEVFTADVPNARSLALGDQGTVFVGTRTRGSVYAVVDEDGDHRADRVHTLARGLFMPNGVAFRQGDLYLAEVNRVLVYRDIESRLGNPPDPEVVVDGLPRDKHHGWKFIAFGPDGRLYIPIGAPCNICHSQDERYATISRVDREGNFEIFAQGVRNSVGFDFHPRTGVLWFTDNGRDLMGDEIPADELNRAPEKGMHFGYPWCHQGDILDPQIGQDKNCDDYVAPARKLGPHVAAIGMRFYTGDMFPEQYKNQIFIAEHGSWNRSTPIGYRITVVRVADGEALSYETLAEGWLQGREAWGRPADVQVMPDGALLISDDEAGVLYRLSYSR
ncbi:MAG TPA: PQQ-dependent sugar dehydrogenase [Acidobacteriota bacterium]|nr:PQQ-dependent sugar dehydrogenase [Acidobacteriota bacterium]